MEHFTVRTKHSAEAYKTYARVHVDARGGSVMARAVAVLLGLLIMAGGVIAIVHSGPGLVFILTIVIGLLVIFGRPLAIWRTARRLMNSCENPDAVIVYDFGGDGFTFTSPDEGGTVSYGEVDRVFETRNYYFVYVALKMAHILRKSDFTQGDARAFGPFLTEKTGKPCVRMEY